MTDYIKTENWKMSSEEKSDSLIEFLFEYIQNHIYCSKVMISGMYMNRFYPARPNNYKTRKSSIKRKISKYFNSLMLVGIVSDFNNNTVRVNQEKFKEFSYNDFFEYLLNPLKN